MCTSCTTQRIAESSYRSVMVDRCGEAHDIIACVKYFFNDVEFPVVIVEHSTGYFFHHAPTGFNIYSAQRAQPGLYSGIADCGRYLDYAFSAIEAAQSECYPALSGPYGRLIVDWQHRERKRFVSGDYLPIPDIDISFDTVHYTHRSIAKDQDDYIAYTPSNEYGLADRQVRIRLGRYLKKFFPDMSDSDIVAAGNKFKAALACEAAPHELHFATDILTINDIFETEMYACGGNYTSCMHNKFTSWKHRPYHVYANSPDVAIAYLTKGDKIVARSVVATMGKEWVRLYSTEASGTTLCTLLEQMLAADGYDEGDLIGCKLTKLDTSKVCLPYIDHQGMEVSDIGHYWRVVADGEGDYKAENTDGTAVPAGDRCSSCSERSDDCECSYCECCDERYVDGCDVCSMCEQCERCISHECCQCDRCDDCNEILSPRSRSTTSCECDRCGECGNLTDNCECPGEEEETEDETESQNPTENVVL